MTDNTPLRIAIVGGGITGLTLAVPLARAQKTGANIDLHVYEAAGAFTEIGAGVGLGPNAQRMLRRLDLIEALENHLDSDTSAEKSYRMFDLLRGEPNLTLEEASVTTVGGENAGVGAVHRADFLESLVQMLPKGQATFNKRVECYVDEPGKPVQLQFADGTTAEADVLIGCDGVKSRVRRCMFAEDSAAPTAAPEGKATRAKYSGWIAYRAVVPFNEVQEHFEGITLGPTLWMGLDRHIVTLPMRKDTLLGLVMIVRDPEGKHAVGKDGPWSEKVSPSVVIDAFKDFNSRICGVTRAVKEPSVWGIFDLPELPWFHEGRVAIAGDAAHATTMHQGAGASQGLEDAFILCTLLTHPTVLSAPRGAAICAALEAYTRVRRDRATKVQRTSRDAGLLYEYRLPGVLDDNHKIHEDIKTRFQWIWEWDEDQAAREALDYFEALMDRGPA